MTSLRALKKLKITECIQFTDIGMADVLSKLPQSLVHFDAMAVNITNDGFRALADSCGARLEHLNISHCEGISDAATHAVSFPSLLHLAIKGTNLTDVGVCALVCSSRSGLRSLNASNVPITDRCLFRISSRAPQSIACLRSLILMGCTNITDAGIIEIAKAAPLLVELNLQAVFDITGGGVRVVASRCPKLAHVTIAGCNLVDDLALYDLVKKCKYLQFLDINMCFGLSEEARTLVERPRRSRDHDVRTMMYAMLVRFNIQKTKIQEIKKRE